MTAQTTTQALDVKDSGPEAMIEQYRGSFEMVLPTHVKADMWVRLSQGVLRRDKKLASAAAANPGSFLSALLDCARLGLEPGETYHLVPFGNEVTGIVDYTGEIELMYRAGSVASVTAEIVYGNDVFEWAAGRMKTPKHTPPVNDRTGRPDWFSTDRGPMVGAYGYADMKDGAVSRVVLMDEAQLAKHRAVSKNPALWKNWPEAMRRKTIVHQLRKWVPSSAEYRTQVLATEARAGEVAAQMHVTLPVHDYGPALPDPNPPDGTLAVTEVAGAGADPASQEQEGGRGGTDDASSGVEPPPAAAKTRGPARTMSANQHGKIVKLSAEAVPDEDLRREVGAEICAQLGLPADRAQLDHDGAELLIDALQKLVADTYRWAPESDDGPGRLIVAATGEAVEAPR